MSNVSVENFVLMFLQIQMNVLYKVITVNKIASIPMDLLDVTAGQDLTWILITSLVMVSIKHQQNLVITV